MKKILKAIFVFTIISTTSSSVFACSIKTWKSTRDYESLPLRQLSIIGFNYTNVQDSIIENWFRDEIREQFNSVKEIVTVLPDTSIHHKYEQWMIPYRNLKIDAIITYAILPYKRDYSIKNYKEYSPIINEPNKISLWSYYVSILRKVEIPKSIVEAPYYVEINIYEQNTLQLIWSGISAPFDDRNDLNRIQRYMEKLVSTAARQGVINSDRD